MVVQELLDRGTSVSTKADVGVDITFAYISTLFTFVRLSLELSTTVSFGCRISVIYPYLAFHCFIHVFLFCCILAFFIIHY